MPWFESSKDKEFRQLIQGKMEICLTRPDKYQATFPILDSQVRKPNQKAIQMIVDHIKQVIKDDNVHPSHKLQAIKLLRDLMQSHSKPLGKYVVKKILKRLTILAQHRKNEKGQQRGANIFKCKSSDQKYGIQFLRVLLLCLSQWGNNWPRNADGPFHDFHSAYNDLLMQKQVTFPPYIKKTNKSPLPKAGFRGSKGQQTSSPPKLVLENKTKIQNPLTKQVIKQRKPLKGPALQYINSMISTLQGLCQILSNNSQFNQMWQVIKSYIDQLKKTNEDGNFLLLQMNESGEQNQQLFNAIGNNSTFTQAIAKDADIVDRKSTSYPKFNQKYVQNCKRLIVSLSIFNDKPSSNNNSLSNLKPAQAQTSLNQKVQQIKTNKPLAQQGRNRYGSSAELRNQLQIHSQQVKKQDFNSNTLNKQQQNSQGSSRYNSVSPNQNDKNRQSLSQFNDPKEAKQKVIEPEHQTSKNEQNSKQNQQEKFSKKKSFQDNNQKKQKFKIEPKSISKITQNQNQTSNNFSKNEFSNIQDTNKDKEANNSFGDFQVPSKNQKIDSNSNFFKELQKKQNLKIPTGTRRNRKVGDKKNNNQETHDFFEVSVKSKVSQNISVFEKSKERANQKSKTSSFNQSNSQIKANNSDSKAFDTFKSPNQIAKGMQQLKKQNASQKSEKSRNSEYSNPFAQKSALQQKNQEFKQNFSGVSNPFQVKQAKNNSNLKKPSNYKDKASEGSEKSFDNPFGTEMQKSVDNPFHTQISKDIDNPFQTQLSKNVDNPFQTKKVPNVYGEQDQNKSKSSNPFSAKNDKNSVSSKYSNKIPRNDNSNPFGNQQKSQLSIQFENPFEKQTNNNQNQNAFGNSFISNPFDKGSKKGNSFQYQKPLSQRGSFLNIEKAEKQSVRNKTNPFEDPFENGPEVASGSKNKQLVSNQNQQRGQVKKQSINNRQSFQSKKQKSERKSKQQQKSAQGFGFDDFMNVSHNKSQTDSNKPHNKSQFGFSDFGNVQNSRHSKVNQFFQNNFFQQTNKSSSNKIEQKEKKNETSFDFFKPSNNKVQHVPQKDNFFQANSKQQKVQFQQFQKNFDQPSKNSNPSMNFGFDDFQNVSISNKNQTLQKSASNPFQKSKQQNSENPFEISKKQQKKADQVFQKMKKSHQTDQMWNKFQRPSSNESDQWKKFPNFQEKNQKNQEPFKDTQSQYQQSQKLQEQEYNRKRQKTPWFSKKQQNINEPQKIQKQPPRFGNQQKSISIQFEQPSPFQKKQIPWQYTLAAIPSSTRYNITLQNMSEKKIILSKLQQQNALRHQKYNQMNEVLTELKKKYSEYLNKLGNVKEQKHEFIMILKRFEESNDIKQKQIQQLIKKKKKAEQIKYKILQNERILYQRIKSDKRAKQTQLIYKQRGGNKYERFNQNLQRQRQFNQPQRSYSHYSYYS